MKKGEPGGKTALVIALAALVAVVGIWIWLVLG